MDLNWAGIEADVLRLRRHEPLWVPKDRIQHPVEAGFYSSVGLNRSADAHFRRRSVGFRGIHVLAFPDHYLVHWDRIDPSVSVVLHFLDDVGWAFARWLHRIVRRPGRGVAPVRMHG